MNKRDFIKTGLLSIIGLSAAKLKANSLVAAKINNEFTIPELLYSSSDINAIFSEAAFSNHYREHYAIYNKSLNKQLSRLVFKPKNTKEILLNSHLYNKSLIDSASGYFNHRLFFRLITPDNSDNSNYELKKVIIDSFGSEEILFKEFTRKTKEISDNGWLWLIVQENKLRVVATQINNNPFLSNIDGTLRGYPIIGIDMWKHAYEPNYGGNKEAYILAVLNNLNWKTVDKRFQQSKTVKIV